MSTILLPPQSPLYAEVAAALPLYNTYTYSIPDHLRNQTMPGKRILAPFGHRNITAYVLDIKSHPPEINVKDFLEVMDEKPLFPAEMIHFFKWMSRYYKYPIGEVIKTALPVIPRKNRMQKLVSVNSDISTLKKPSIGSVKEHMIQTIEKSDGISMDLLKKFFPTAIRHVRELQKTGILSVTEKRIFRDPFKKSTEKDCPPQLTREQEKVIEKVLKKPLNRFNAFLLTGITGSGKTEVYLRLAAEIISKGKNVLVLVPEIALVSQIMNRFIARFGDELAILHSGLSDGQRYDQWSKIASGKVRMAIGTRSAIFAPFQKLGLIVVDEEHDTSYKQESGFHYNARDLSLVRAQQNSCTALLGSATPSVQSYYNVKIGKFQELVLTHRIENRPLARTTIVDLRDQQSAKGFHRFISPKLFEAMNKTLARKEQILLFLNRRGFASYPICATCGSAIRCKNCEITLTLHKSDNSYKCHFCGYTMAVSSSCPSCGSSNIMHLGLGTEKLEESIKKMFPDARTVRMDRDTTRRKGILLKILKDLKHHKIDILIGTQMVAKGHDFPNITLVGIICADLSLNFPDFRAGERTFQLLTQVAGRAGRGQMPGEVILQTYNPNHFTILAASDQDFKRFYNNEIHFRKSLNYPPFSRLIQLLISGKNQEKTKMFAIDLGKGIKSLHGSNPFFYQHIEILGPIEAPIPKIAQNYRWHLLLKSLNTSSLHTFLNRLINRENSLFNNRQVRVTVDVDPCWML